MQDHAEAIAKALEVDSRRSESVAGAGRIRQHLGGEYESRTLRTRERQRRGRELPEQRSELVNNGFYADADRVEHGPGVYAVGQRGVLERNVDNETGVHVHLWVRRVEVESGKFCAQLQEARRKARDRLYNITKPCPPFDPVLGGVPDTPDVVDGLVTVVVYKDSKARRRGMEKHTDLERFGYTYGRTTLITRSLVTPPQLNEAFVAAMGDLKARRVSEQKPPAR
jgi:hypothetical protein